MKYPILAVLAFLFVSTSCNKEKKSINDIIGTWRTEKEVEIEPDGTTDEYTYGIGYGTALSFTESDWPEAAGYKVVYMDGAECGYDMSADGTEFVLSEDPTDPDDGDTLKFTFKDKNTLVVSEEYGGWVSEMHMKRM